MPAFRVPFPPRANIPPSFNLSLQTLGLYSTINRLATRSQHNDPGANATAAWIFICLVPFSPHRQININVFSDSDRKQTSSTNLREARPIGARYARLALLSIADQTARTMIASHARRCVMAPDARIAWTVRMTAFAQRCRSRRRLRFVTAAGTVLDKTAQMGDFTALMGDIVAQLFHNRRQILDGFQEEFWN